MTNHRRTGPARVGSIVPPHVRRWLYGIAAAAAPLAVVYGYVTDQQAVLWLNLAGSVLFTLALGNTPPRPAELEQDDPETEVDPLDPSIWPTA